MPVFRKIVLLFSILRRVVKLLATQAVLEASNEASLKQAKGASDHCQKLMEENEKLTKVNICTNFSHSPHNSEAVGDLTTGRK